MSSVPAAAFLSGVATQSKQNKMYKAQRWLTLDEEAKTQIKGIVGVALAAVPLC